MSSHGSSLVHKSFFPCCFQDSSWTWTFDSLILCLCMDLFQFTLFGALWAYWIWVSDYFLWFGKFSALFLLISSLSLPLICYLKSPWSFTFFPSFFFLWRSLNNLKCPFFNFAESSAWSGLMLNIFNCCINELPILFRSFLSFLSPCWSFHFVYASFS